MTPDVDPALRVEIAPGASLRVGLNLANFLVVSRDPAGGAPRGIAVDLADAIAGALELPRALTCFDTPGTLADAAQRGELDLAFLSPEPSRTPDLAFTRPYIEVEASYLVPADSALCDIDAVDRAGVRVAVVAGSGYALFLSRTVQHAQLVPERTHEDSYRRFVAERLDALAGLRPRLQAYARRLPGSRLIDGRFTAVPQAIGVPKGRPAALAWLDAFIARATASGQVATLIERHGKRGQCSIPEPPGPATGVAA